MPILMIRYFNSTKTAKEIGVTRGTLRERLNKGIMPLDAIFEHGSREIPIFSQAYIETYKGIKLKPGRKSDDQVKNN